ncbi:hypothetical protein Q5P01_012143 [Channa striata]|uniref:Uncharacterized protein n=1 Tax=Channa striata TaxID=64152 RepID=A0AA88SMJ7_CHASR|nr:hypothetical protein Q5P01_012143 [Channa striata]
MGWVAQGLTKVLPQPDEKYRETDTVENEEHTEVYDVATMPDFDPLPHIPVVEMVSDEEVSEAENLTPQFPPKMVNWIKQIIPQPVTLPPGAVPAEPSSKSSRSSLDKIFSPPPESLSGISLDTDSKASGVVGWFVSGLGLKMPQPAIPPKDGTEGAAEVLQKASSKLKPDMVLEDVESDNEGQHKRENPSKAAAAPSTSLTSASPSTHQHPQQQAAAQHTQSNSLLVAAVQPQKSGDANSEPSDSAAKISLEDAETQTGRWTPFIESIKKEAEDVALATMEERLLQERMEMARMAEEVARQTAEMAIRQMASEGHSIKLSLDSQEQLEEPEAELIMAQEEESEAEDCKTAEKDESLVEEEQKEETEEPTGTEPEEPQQTSPSPPPSPEPVKTSEPEPEPEPAPEPETQKTSSELEPVTQQPQKAEDNGQDTSADKAADKEEEAKDDGCGAPVSCDAFKNCLMRIPHTSECFGNINAFFKENGISSPKLPSMPKLPTQFSDVIKYFPSLPPELREELTHIRLTRVPRNIAQTLTELFPKSSEGSVGPSLSSVSQQFSDIPQKLSQFPSRTQQYFLNVRNRLNSLMPQDA